MATPDYRTERLGQLNKLAEQNRGLLSADPIFRKVYDGLDPIKRQRVDLGGLNLAELVSDYEQANLPQEQEVAPEVAPTEDDFLTRVGKTAIGFGDVVTSGIESKFTNYDLAGIRRAMALSEEDQAAINSGEKLETDLEESSILDTMAPAKALLGSVIDLYRANKAENLQADPEGTQALLDKLIAARADQKARSQRGYAAIDESGDPARITRAAAAVASQPEQALPLLASAGATVVGSPLAGLAASAATAPVPAIVVYDSAYNDAVDAGLDDKDADSFAKWMAGSEYALEAFTGGIAGSFGKTVLKSAIKQWAKQTGKMALVEGASEAATGTLQDAGNLVLSETNDGKLGDYAQAQLPKSLGDFILRRYDEILAGTVGGTAITAAPNAVAAIEDSTTERKFDALKRSADAVEEATRISNASPNIVAAAAKGAQQATQLNLPGFGDQQKLPEVEAAPIDNSAQLQREEDLRARGEQLTLDARQGNMFADAAEARANNTDMGPMGPRARRRLEEGEAARTLATEQAKEAGVIKLGVAAVEQELPLTGGEMGTKNFEDVVVGGKPYVRNKLTGELQDKRQMRIEEAKVAQQLKDKEALVAKAKARETARKKYETSMIKRAADLGKDSTYVDEKMKQWDAEINPVPKVEDISAARIAAAQKADQVGSKPTGKRPKAATTKTEDATAAMDALAGITAPPPANLESVRSVDNSGRPLEPVADDAKLRVLARVLVRGLGLKNADGLTKALDKGGVKVVRHPSQIPGWTGSKTEGVYNDKDGSIYLVASELQDSTAAAVVYHEVGHKFQKEGAGKKHRNAVMQMMGEDGLNKVVRDMEEAARRGNEVAKRAKRRATSAMERAGGDVTVYKDEMVGYAITEAELARNNRSPFGLSGVIRDITDNLNIAYSNVFKTEIFITPEILANLNRRDFTKTLEAGLIKNDTTDSTPGARESVGGKTATTFERNKTEGKTYEGSVDGKERFTFSDAGSKVRKEALARLTNGETVKLAELMLHPQLFKNYPELKEVKVVHQSGSSEYGGWWVQEDNTITITDGGLAKMEDSAESARSVILHEVQHAIQDIEGFTGGTSSQWMVDTKVLEEYNDAVSGYTQALKDFPLGKALRLLPKEASSKFAGMLTGKERATERAAKFVESSLSDELIDTELEAPLLKVGTSKYKMEEAAANYDAALVKAREAYTRAYGEAEARATAAFRDLTQAELDKFEYESAMDIDKPRLLEAEKFAGKVNKDSVLESVATIEENLPPKMFESVAMELAMLSDGTLKRPEESYNGPMIATHNTRLDKLASVIKRGLIMPSIGILNNNSRIPNEFGEITLVLKKGFLRPNRNNRMVAADSYSKTVQLREPRKRAWVTESEYVRAALGGGDLLSQFKFSVGGALNDAFSGSKKIMDKIDEAVNTNAPKYLRRALQENYQSVMSGESIGSEIGFEILTGIMFDAAKDRDELNTFLVNFDLDIAQAGIYGEIFDMLPAVSKKDVAETDSVISIRDGEYEAAVNSKKGKQQLQVRNPKAVGMGGGGSYGVFLAQVKPEISNLTQLRKEARLLNKYRADRDVRDMYHSFIGSFGGPRTSIMGRIAELAKYNSSDAAILDNLQKDKRYSLYPGLIPDAMAVYRAARNAWVDYFEAKHGGVLDFEKSVAAVAVDATNRDALERVKKLLKEAGIDVPVVQVRSSKPGGPKEPEGGWAPEAKDLIQAVQDQYLTDAIWRANEKDVPKTGYESVYEAPESEAFKTWFGNSKIEDGNGNPLKFYHGAPGGAFGFNTFMRNSLGLIFVSTEKKFASIFAGIQDDTFIGGGVRDSGGVYELYVRAEKPFDYENSDDIDRLLEGNDSVLLAAYHSLNGFDQYSDATRIADTKAALKVGDWSYYETPAVIMWMEDNGYDAMYIKEANAKNLAVFDPNQLKSANANQGTFRLDSNNIYESVVDESDDSGTKQAVRGIGRLLGIDKLLAPTALNRIVDHPGGYTAHIAVLADTQAALWKEAEARAAKKRGVKPKVIRGEIDKRIAAIDKLTDQAARASALLALDRDYPGVGKAVAKIRDLKWGLSRTAYSLRRKDPKPLTDKEVAIYKKMFENAETYNTRAYQATFGLKSEKYGKEFLKRANKDPKSEEGIKLAAAVKYLVDNNLLIPDATTLSNMKKPQLRRMYETWSNRAPGKMKRATMIAELGKIVVPNRTALEAKALRIIEEMLGQTKTLGPVAKQFVGQKLDRTILEARKTVPQELRDVMGEITDPYVKELLSIARLTQLVARTKMLNELSEQGKDTLWTDEKGENTKFQVNGEAFGPLDGKWVNADVQQLLRDQLTMTTSIEDAINGAQREPEQAIGKAGALVVRGAQKIAGWWKLTNIVFSPQNFGANLVGSPAMAIMNGVYSPTTWTSSFYKTAKALASAEFPGNEKGGDYAAEYLYAKVLDSATIGEFRGQVYDNIFSEIAKLDNKDPNFVANAGKKVWDMIGTGVASAREGYALMDVWAKVASYEVRKEQLTDYYKALGITKSAKEISREAGYDVSLSNISYERAPPIIKMIERTVPFAAFLTYFSEVFRSVGGSYYLAAQDASRAAQAVSAGNAKAAAIMGTAAVKRLAGTVAATGGVIALTNYMLDSEDEEEKRKRLLDPDWETNNPRVVLGQDANGKDITLGLNRLDPLGPLNEAVVAVMRAKDGERWEQIGVEIEGMLVKNRGAMQFYKTIWDASLKTADTLAPNLLKDIMGRVEFEDLSTNVRELLWQYVPAPLKSLSPEYPVIASNRATDQRALGDALTGIGAKLYVRDEDKAIKFRVWDFKGTTDAIRKDYRTFLEEFDGSPEELYTAVEELAEREEKAVADLAAAYDGYQAYGKTSRDFLAILKDEKVDGNTVKGLLTGEYRSGIFSSGDLDTMFKVRAKALDRKAPDYAEQLQALREEKAMFRDAYLRLRESE